MAKVIDRGLAKPDDPIYKTGLILGGKRFPKSTGTSPKDTDGDQPPSPPYEGMVIPGFEELAEKFAKERDLKKGSKGKKR